MKPEKGSSEKATTPISAISISVEPCDLELSEELLRMEPEVRRRLEQEVAARMAAHIEAMLFSAPGSGFVCFPYERADQPFVFYRIKS
jgi:hypothetical protein